MLILLFLELEFGRVLSSIKTKYLVDINKCKHMFREMRTQNTQELPRVDQLPLHEERCKSSCPRDEC
jgi:hypothetical protein